MPHVQYQPTEKHNKTIHVPSSYSQTIGEQPCFTTTETAFSTTVSNQGTDSSTKQAKMDTESYSATAADSQCIYTSNGSGNQTTRASAADTHPQQAPVPSATPQPGKLTGATDIIPEFQSGKVDAKKFRPHHYNIDSLEIGTWRVSTCMPNLLKKHCGIH